MGTATTTDSGLPRTGIAPGRASSRLDSETHGDVSPHLRTKNRSTS
jgi:hypothetical protein